MCFRKLISSFNSNYFFEPLNIKEPLHIETNFLFDNNALKTYTILQLSFEADFLKKFKGKTKHFHVCRDSSMQLKQDKFILY